MSLWHFIRSNSHCCQSLTFVFRSSHNPCIALELNILNKVIDAWNFPFQHTHISFFPNVISVSPNNRLPLLVNNNLVRTNRGTIICSEKTEWGSGEYDSRCHKSCCHVTNLPLHAPLTNRSCWFSSIKFSFVILILPSELNLWLILGLQISSSDLSSAFAASVQEAAFSAYFLIILRSILSHSWLS